jgi:hypothetical protein
MSATLTIGSSLDATPPLHVIRCLSESDAWETAGAVHRRSNGKWEGTAVETSKGWVCHVYEARR